MQIDRNSWHWKVIRMVNAPWIEDRVTDSCTYIKTLAVSCLKLSIFCFVLGALLIFGILGVYELGGIVFGYVADPDANVAAVGVMFIGFPLISYFVYMYLKLTVNRRYEVKPKGLLAQAIDRAKNKYCSKIEFLD